MCFFFLPKTFSSFFELTINYQNQPHVKNIFDLILISDFWCIIFHLMIIFFCVEYKRRLDSVMLNFRIFHSIHQDYHWLSSKLSTRGFLWTTHFKFINRGWKNRKIFITFNFNSFSSLLCCFSPLVRPSVICGNNELMFILILLACSFKRLMTFCLFFFFKFISLRNSHFVFRLWINQVLNMFREQKVTML